MLRWRVKNFWMGIIAGMLSASAAWAATNTVSADAPAPAAAAQSKKAIDEEFHKIMELDDAAQAEVDGWIKENQEFAAKGAGMPPQQMRRRILDRLDPVDKAYADFVKRHPEHVQAKIAYASFLGDVKGEEAAQEQLEAALALDTNNPAIYNNLANIYGHNGNVKKAFDYYAKALQLNPLESTYYHNFGTTVFLFRKDAEEYYHIDEKQVFAKAFALYSNAIRLDPENFPLASDVAQSYYVVKPLPTDTALRAWTNALSIAHDEIEREGVYIHFARVNLMSGRFKEARAHLNSVTNEMYAELRSKLQRNIVEREKEQATNTVQRAGSEQKGKREQ